jgi:DNA-binding IclR family transcriptional regulator
LDHEEFLEGLCCVAVPLHDAAGRVIAIMSTALPAARATESRLHELTGVLVEHGAAASARLRLERVVAQRYGV